MRWARPLLAAVLVLLMGSPASAQLDRLLKGLPGASEPAAPGADLSDSTIVSGLKEALQVGAGNTIDLTGRVDGYLKNEAIRILLPDSLRTVEQGLRVAGFGPQVDEFVVSMNRAAERAAPQAREIFTGAITRMSFDDARKILAGGDAAATEYFRGSTTDRLTAAFAPIVGKSMNEVGVTRQYQELVGRVRSIPFARVEALDLDRYVVDKSLDGLFQVLAEQERQIRTDPAARTTSLLKQVFGR